MQGNRAKSISFYFWRRKSRYNFSKKLDKLDQNLCRETLVIENKVIVRDGNCMNKRISTSIQQNAKKKISSTDQQLGIIVRLSRV